MIKFKIRLADNELFYHGDDKPLAVSLISQFFAASEAAIQQRIDRAADALKRSREGLQEAVKDASPNGTTTQETDHGH